MNRITVTTVVTVNGESKTVTADASTEANPYRVAYGMVQSLSNEAQQGLSDAKYDWDTKAKATPPRPGR